jgi:hypothetical protein
VGSWKGRRGKRNVQVEGVQFAALLSAGLNPLRTLPSQRSERVQHLHVFDLHIDGRAGV